MRGAFATFAVIAAVILAGCTSTPGHPDPTTAATPAPTTTPVVSDPPDTGSAPTSPPPVTGTDIPTDVPTTGPNLRHKGERPPAMPLLATQHTRAGAVAFAQFFELTIDWAYATTSTTYMRHYYTHSCVTCRSIQLGLDNAAKKGRHFIGGRMTITNAVDKGVDTRYGAERRVSVTYRLTAVEVVDKSGRFVDGGPAVTMDDNVWLSWISGRWMAVELGPAA
jgi:hypothetical protein